MARVTSIQVAKDLRKSKFQLYEQLGAQYIIYKHGISTQKVLFSTGEIRAIRTRYTKSYLRNVGKSVYSQYKTKLKRSICVKFRWCEKSESIKQHRSKITYGVLISNIIAIWLPPWAAASAFYALTLKIHKDLDKYCKCTKRKTKKKKKTE